MRIEETVTTSWFDRVRKSAAGIGAGLVLVAGTTGFLFWNEGRALQTARSLAEGAGLVVPVAANRVEPGNEGRLIHLTGPTTSGAPLADAEFGVTVPGLVLVRQVEMFQWIQKSETRTEVNTGGSETRVTSYSYARDWAREAVDSAKFREPQGHVNPPMRISRAEFMARDARLGAFALDRAVIGQLGAGAPWTIPADQSEAVQAAVGAAMRASLVGDAISLGRDPARPEIGDYRIRYSLVPLEEISVVGRQAGAGIASFRTASGDSLLMVAQGNRDARDMFAGAASANAMTTWAFRIGGIAVMIAGFAAILAPLAVLASVLPFLGSIVAFGTRSIATVLGLALGGGTIALAWFFHRPLLSLAILAVVAALIGGVMMLARRRRALSAAA